MKVLITGGFGYLGGRLGAYLSTFNHDIYLASRFSKKEPNISNNINTIEIDWTDYNSILDACEDMDVVIHSAGMNASDCLNDPKKAFEVNGVFTGKLGEAAIAKKVSTFLYLSTAHIYSNNLNGLITEETEVTNSHPYGASRFAGEEILISQNKNKKSNMQTIIVRLANTFGSPSDIDINCWNLVVNDLCKQAAIDRCLVIRGPSNTKRNFITMTDFCSAINFLLFICKLSEPTAIFNLGDKTKSIINIANDIIKIYQSEKDLSLPIIELSENKLINNDLEYSSNALIELGWKPDSNFNFELTNLIRFCESNFNNSVK